MTRNIYGDRTDAQGRPADEPEHLNAVTAPDGSDYVVGYGPGSEGLPLGDQNWSADVALSMVGGNEIGDTVAQLSLWLRQRELASDNKVTPTWRVSCELTLNDMRALRAWIDDFITERDNDKAVLDGDFVGFVVGETYRLDQLSKALGVEINGESRIVVVPMAETQTPPPFPPLTKRTYPVAWEASEFVMWGRLGFERGREGLYLARWNGFVEPAFTRPEIERYNEWVRSQPNDELGGDRLYTWVEWEGDVAIEHDPQDPDGIPTRIAPTADGLYFLGSGWTWQLVESEL